MALASTREANTPRSISLSTWRTQASALTLVVKVWDWMGYPRRRGACQGSCRLSYALLRFSVEGSRAALIAASRSGFKVTTALGDQLRVGPDQRRGCLSLAS